MILKNTYEKANRTTNYSSNRISIINRTYVHYNLCDMKKTIGYKRRPNIVRWFAKHGVSSNVISGPHAVMRAIESQIKNK